MERIGRYKVEGEIGRGAMGVVYLAHDPRVRRRLALKTYELPQGIAPEQAREYRERFVREAQSAGALSHPAIVTIYDVDEDPENGASYIAMEYVPGNSLRKLLRTLGRMEPERAVLLGTTVAEALQVAHDAGIVHRDVKPDNILVREPDGAFKIADFGIARLHDSDLTQAGLTVGSPAYMSPEQIRSRDVDGRSDLFSLASVLYEALSGKRPFDGKDLPALAYAVAHESPRPISGLAPGLPASLDEFFAKALAKKPAERFQDGKSFALALREAWARRFTNTPQPGVGAATSGADQAGPDRGPEISGNSGRTPSDSWMTDSDEEEAKDTAPLAAADEQPETDSQPRAYRPQSPEKVLRRAQEEQRRAQKEQQLKEVSIIPLARKGRRRSGEDEEPTVRRSDPALASSSHPSLPRVERVRHWRQARLLMIVAALAAAALWWNFPVAEPLVSVGVEVTNRLGSGDLTVMMDDKIIYGVELSVEHAEAAAPDGAQAKSGNGKFKSAANIPPGEHIFMALVKPNRGSRSYQAQVKVDVQPGETRRLRILTGNESDPTPKLKFE